MDSNEARTILSKRLAKYRSQDYSELLSLVDRPHVTEVLAPSGVKYQLEVEAVWDDGKKRTLRVIGSIDDGGVRAFFPLSADFVMAPDGTFIDEQFLASSAAPPNPRLHLTRAPAAASP